LQKAIGQELERPYEAKPAPGTSRPNAGARGVAPAMRPAPAVVEDKVVGE
jgi:hypothetical protein